MNKSTMPWLTPKMEEEGLTETVINYLTGKIQKLPNTISWQEFFYLWIVQRDDFEKTEIFEQKFSVLAEKATIENIRILATTDERRELIINWLPVKLAVHICENFRDYFDLFGRAKTKSEKSLILNGIHNLLPEEEFDNDMIVDYYEMSKGFPDHLSIAWSLIELKVSQKDMMLHELGGFRLPENLVRGLLRNEEVDTEDCFLLFERTGYKFILEKIKEKIKQSNGDSGTIDVILREIKASLNRFAEKEVTAPIKDPKLVYLPLIECLVAEASTDRLSQLLQYSELLGLLPKYDPENPSIQNILTKVTHFMRDVRPSGYQLGLDEFIAWYSYSKEQAFVELSLKTITDGSSGGWKDKIGKAGWWQLEKMINVYDLCKDDRILTVSIQDILPDSSYPLHAVEFLKWIKGNKPDFWGAASDAILKGKRVEAWFKKCGRENSSSTFNRLLSLLIV